MISTPGNTNHAHPHVHSLPKPGQLGGGPLVLSLDKGRVRMDSQKFLIPSLPVSSRPDPSAQKRRERSIVNGTASLTSSENSTLYHPHSHSQHVAGPTHPFNGFNGSSTAPINGRRSSTIPGGYPQNHSHAHTGLPPPTNSPRKDAHSPMYHHHIHPMGVAVAAATASDSDIHHIQHHQNYHGHHRASVPIPCSSPARAASASPKSASSLSPSTSSKSSYSTSPQLPGGQLSAADRLYSVGFTHHPNIGVSNHAAALYAAAAAAQPLPYTLFGGYPHAATTYLDNFHSSIMAQQQKQIGIGMKSPAPPGASPPMNDVHDRNRSDRDRDRDRRPTPDIVSPFYPPLHSTATTQFHSKLIDSILPIERVYNGHHHSQSKGNSHSNHHYQQQHSANLDRLHGHGHPGFPSLPNGVSVSLSKGQGSPQESHRMGSISQSLPYAHVVPIGGGKYYNSKSSLTANSISNATLTNNGVMAIAGSNKFWNSPNGGSAHVQTQPQPFKVTSPAVLGSASKHEDFKSSVLYGGRQGSLKHRILNTGTSRSPEPMKEVLNLSPSRGNNSNSKSIFQFPNLSSTPVNLPHTNELTSASAHGPTGAIKYEYEQNGQRPNNEKNISNIPWNFSMSDKSGPNPHPRSAPPSSPPFKYLSQVYKPSTSNSGDTILSAQIQIQQSPAVTVPQKYEKKATPSPKTPPVLSPQKKAPSPPVSTPTTTPPLTPGLPNGINTKPITKSLASGAAEPLPVEQMPMLNAFQCGSMIQLASGDLKAVEDLRIEDFFQAAAKAADSLRIIHCTVISIKEIDTNGAGAQELCKVTLAMGAQKQQVVVDTKPEQPFFILGRGWSSWSPVKTQKVLQLPCTPLSVGDVCITLSKQSKSTPMHVPPRSPTVKSSKNYSILSFPNSKLQTKSPRLGTGNSNGKNAVSRSSASNGKSFSNGVGRKLTKDLEAKAMLPPPMPLTPKTILKISAVLDEKEQTEANATAISTGNRPVTPKKRRWSAPEVVTDEDSGEDSKIEVNDGEPPPMKMKKISNSIEPITA